MEVRRKAIAIVLSMTSSRNVEEVVLFMKKQLQKTQEADFEKVAGFYSTSQFALLTFVARHPNTASCSSNPSMSLPSSFQKLQPASSML